MSSKMIRKEGKKEDPIEKKRWMPDPKDQTLGYLRLGSNSITRRQHNTLF